MAPGSGGGTPWVCRVRGQRHGRLEQCGGTAPVSPPRQQPEPPPTPTPTPTRVPPCSFDKDLKYKSKMFAAPSTNEQGGTLFLVSVAVHHLTGRIFCTHFSDANVQVFAGGRYLSTVRPAA